MSAQLHVEVVGRGPPLVLLHGWAMHGGVFAPLVERLRERCTLHLVDLPGHGMSRDCGVPLALDACIDAIAAQVPAAPWCGWLRLPTKGGGWLAGAFTRLTVAAGLTVYC